MNVTRAGDLDLTDVRHVSDETDRRVVDGDVLFNNTNSPALVGKTALVKSSRPLAFSNHMTRLRPPEGVSSAFLAAQLHWLWSTGYFRSVLKNHVNQASVATKKLLETPVLIPPLAEQKRIVEAIEGHLSKLDAAVSNLSLAQTKVDRLESLLFGKAARGGFSDPVHVSDQVDITDIEQKSRALGTRRWKPVSPTELPNYILPHNWTMASLGTLSYASGYGTSTKCEYGAAGQPVLRIPNVQDGTIDLTDVKWAVDSEIDLTKFFLEPGDLLFVRTNGSPRLIGRVGVVEKPLRYAFASYLIRFRLTPGIVEPRWVELVTQSPLWRRAIEKYAASSAGQYNLSADTLSRIPIPLPPLQVQRRILDAVDFALTGARRLASATTNATKRANQIRNTVLAHAFAGTLVPQDPDDEPASALLARIQGEQKALGSRRARNVTTRHPRVPVTARADVQLSPDSVPSINAVKQEFDL